MIYQSGLENSGLKSLLSKLVEQEYKLQHLRAMVTFPQHPPESSGAKILHYFSRLQSHIQQWHGNAFPSGLQSLNERFLLEAYITRLNQLHGYANGRMEVMGMEGKECGILHGCVMFVPMESNMGIAWPQRETTTYKKTKCPAAW